MLALQGAVLLAVVAGHGQGGPFRDLHGWRRVAELSGAALLLIATLVVAAAVMPLLGPARQHKKEYRNNLIYFGHLRHWDAEQLAQRLYALTDHEHERQLSRQLVRMAERNWMKHRLLQVGIVAALAGAMPMVLAAVWPA